MMRLVQYKDEAGERHVGLVGHDGSRLHPLRETPSTYELALSAIEQSCKIAKLVQERASEESLDYDALLANGQILTPIDHPEPARLLVTGTGLTHLGSADARNKMHVMTHGQKAPESDSFKIYNLGIEGGKPDPGQIGVQPEWFFKGLGTAVVAPQAPLPLPAFALAGAEEPEIVGHYLIDENGAPCRIGWSLGNDFSDHVTEAQNYLYLQHSKLRACALGPELLLGELPLNLSGMSRIIRDGKTLWEEEFFSGEENMSHSIANLEHYHFRYDMFRRPGDLHAYFIGAAVLSYAAGIKTRPGDEFEIESSVFGKPLRNRMVLADDEGLVTVKSL